MQEIGAGEPSGFPPRELAIEALIAVGDLDEARVQLEWLDEAGRRRATLWPLAMGSAAGVSSKLPRATSKRGSQAASKR